MSNYVLCVRFGESFLATWSGSEEIAIEIALRPDPRLCVCVRVLTLLLAGNGEGFV